MVVARRGTQSKSDPSNVTDYASLFEDAEKSPKQKRRGAQCMTGVLLIVCCRALGGSSFFEREDHSRSMATKKYQNCSIAFRPLPARTEEEWRKPLWVPSFPSSGSAAPSKQGDLLKSLLDSMTGLDRGSKNFHMSMRKRLKRCIGITETVACSNGHPYVPVNPHNMVDKFHSSVIYVIRNFATAFPMSLTDKNIAYHDGKGQISEANWREARDQYMEASLQTWMDMIKWWKEANYYKIALFVPYERLLDPQKGPMLVQSLSDTIKAAGFDVAPAEDIPCIWFRVASEEWKRLEKMTTYNPGFTSKQKQLIIDRMNKFLKENEGDNELSDILKDYIKEIRDDIKLDV